GARAGGIPATVGGPPAAAPLPAATPPEATPTARPENTAAGPAPPWKPPAANIPGPPVPALPTLPPSTPPGDGKKSQRPVKRGANFALVDALDRPWNLATSRQGSVVLVEFLTTTCGPCKAAVPGLVDVQSRYAADGLELVGVVCDEAPVRDRLDRAEKYRQAHQLNYALYAEPGPLPGAVRDRLGVTAYPTAVLLDPEGNVAWKGHPGDRSAMEAAVRRALGK
ncbi:MAG: TlpA family protein disulfide reductase, partial [Gemmataceae bacterium]|nr:TlpA family protein disulfide reductase [Gemmataceae bacterium]